MKYWPGGALTPQGDNPPWNMYEMRSMALFQVDNGSGGVAPIASELWGLITPPGVSFQINPIAGVGATCQHFITKTDLTQIFNMYGAVVEMNTPFTDPDKAIIVGTDYHTFHRVWLEAGLADENTTGDPTNYALKNNSLLIDNQPLGAAAATLTATASSWGAPNTGLIEIGFRCGEEFNGQYWPKVVDSIAVVLDEHTVFANCDIYKSYDGNIWFPVPKAQYNSNGWVNGEYAVVDWRQDEIGAPGENARVFAFAAPQYGNYFKVVFNNSAGSTLTIKEVYGFNHQGEVSFSSDLVHNRHVMATKQGNNYLFDLQATPVYRVGTGPLGPSGDYAQLDTLTGVWRDFGSESWYDYTLGAWIRSDGTYWDSANSVWAAQTSLSTSTGTITVLDIEDSTETYLSVRQINYVYRSFNPLATLALTNEAISVKLMSVYNFPPHVDTYDSTNQKTNHMRIPSTASAIGESVVVRVYNNNSLTSKGLQAWADPQGQEVAAEAVRVAEIGTNQIILKDDAATIAQTRNVLSIDRSGVASFGDSSLAFAGGMVAWAEVAAGPVGDQYSVAYATGIVTTGNVVPAAPTYSHAYAAEGASACEVSQNNAAWTTFPTTLTFTGGVVAPGQYLILYVRSNLTPFADERDRPAKVEAKYNY